LINNAGILRDKSFKSMSEKEWDIVQEVHVKGAYACSKAVWPVFRKQKFGRIINVRRNLSLFYCSIFAPLPRVATRTRKRGGEREDA